MGRGGRSLGCEGRGLMSGQRGHRVGPGQEVRAQEEGETCFSLGILGCSPPFPPSPGQTRSCLQYVCL